MVYGISSNIDFSPCTMKASAVMYLIYQCQCQHQPLITAIYLDETIYLIGCLLH